jgi:multidrug efflux system membrane fusion protein
MLALAACGDPAAPAEVARPVLVAHPGDSTGAQGQAYAGEIRAREESALSFRVGGKLVRRLVDVGDQVRRGQVLAELDASDLQLQVQAARAQLAAAEGELARAGADRSRFQALSAQQLVSHSALDAQQALYAAAAGQARAARASLDVARNQAAYARLVAPASGVIAARYAEAGQVVAAGQAVFAMAGSGGREVAIALPESVIDGFGVGQRATVELWSAPGKRLAGQVREIAPAADPQTRSYAARVALLGAPAVSLGQSARVFFEAAAGARAGTGLTVPLAAVQRGAGNATAVWIVDPATRRVHLAPVRLGAYGDERVPVLAGVRAGDWIVAAGGHLLREGELVAPVDRQDRPVLEAVARQP